jgi:hypothetical protein
MARVLTVKIKIQGYIDRHYIHIPAVDKSFFPPNGTSFKVDTNVGAVIVPNGQQDQRLEITGLRNWYNAHREVVVGDKVTFTEVNPGTRYRLDVLKK